nr:doublesex and mab 3 transcription [Hymenolepis microstoma]
MDRAAIETNPSPRDWLNQSLKVEPGFTATSTSRRVVCGTGTANTSAYFSATTTAHFESTESNSDYTAFTIPRLGATSANPNTTFPVHHAFGPPPPSQTGVSPPMVPIHPVAPPTDPSGTLTRAHAMHSLFETYTTFESGTTRQHTSVRMDHHILPTHPVKSGRCRKDSVSSTEDTGKESASGDMEAGSGSAVVSRASYMCRKCKAHGQAVPVKRHKRACPYLQCRCLKCRLVDQGRKVVARQIALYRDQKGHSGNFGSNNSNSRGNSRHTRDDNSSYSRLTGLRSNPLLQLPFPRELRLDENRILPSLMNNPSAKTGQNSALLIPERNVAGPHCRRCRNHNVAVTWKGHKKSCPYRNCPCDPCRLINVRKDTEKTLRDMAGIEEKSVLPTALLSEESTTTQSSATSTGMTNFFPYLTPVNNATQAAEMEEPSANNPEQPSWHESSFIHRPPRRTRSLQDLNAQITVSESQMNEQGGNHTNTVEQTRESPLEASRNPVPSANSSNSGSTANTSHSANNTTNSNNVNSSSTFEQCHRNANYDMYYEEKAPRPVLPFWQSFGHFEEKPAVPGHGYIGGYYGLENGRVFHGNSQSHHHMYSPERVSAVAAAAAAAAAMVAMTPPISGNYQQPCYPHQGRSGGLCHPQHSDHLGYTPSDEFNSAGMYQNRFLTERSRGDDYVGGTNTGNNGNWGAYRYPYMMRGLPFHPGDPGDSEFGFTGSQRHGKLGMTKVVDESIYSRPNAAQVWRSQLHQLSISQLRPMESDEMKNFQQIECENKINDVKRGTTDEGSRVQTSNAGLGIRSEIESDQRPTGGFGEEFPSSNGSRPIPPQQTSQQNPTQQPSGDMIFEADPRSTSESQVNVQYRQYNTTGGGGNNSSPFAQIDEGQPPPHPFPSTVGAET